jgi:hypothetical protein
VTLGCAAEFATFARSDMAFLLYAAGRVLDGARLYVDVVEINPPLIVALNLPAVLLARALGVSDIAVLRLLLSAALLGSLAFSAWALRQALGTDRTRFRPLVILIAFLLFLLPGNVFGQREHLLVGLALPYVLLAVARANGRPAAAAPAFAAGLLAGAGLALKPHFLLVWVAIEGYAAWRLRASRPSPEAMGALAFLICYVAGVAIFTPEYFRMILLLGPAYGGFGHDPFLHVLISAPGTPECYLAVLTWAVFYARARHPTLWVVLLVGLVASFVAGAAQQKGWTYHFYPARVFALMVLGLAVMDVRRPLARSAQRIYAAVAFGVLGTSVLWAVVMGVARITDSDSVREHERAQLDQLVAAVRRHAPPDGSLHVLSYTIGSSFPLVNYSGVRWASRFPHLWIIEAVYQDQLHGEAALAFHRREAMGPAERYLNDAVYEDLARYRPDVLLVLRHARDVRENALRRLDYLGYFGRDERIAALLKEYRFGEDVGQYRLYVRAKASDSPGVPPTSAPGKHDVLRSRTTGGSALLSDSEFLLHLLTFVVLACLAYGAERRRAQRDALAGAGQGAA